MISVTFLECCVTQSDIFKALVLPLSTFIADEVFSYFTGSYIYIYIYLFLYIYLTFLSQNFPSIIVLTAESNILEHDDSLSHNWLLFSVDEFHYLNAARVASTTAYSDFDFTLKCHRNPFCQSINLATSKDTNGKLWCELLSSDRYKNSLDYKESKISHNHFLLVGSVSDTSSLLDYMYFKEQLTLLKCFN